MAYPLRNAFTIQRRTAFAMVSLAPTVVPGLGVPAG